MKYFRLIFIFFFSQLSHKIYSQNIKDLDFEYLKKQPAVIYDVKNSIPSNQKDKGL